MEKAMRLQKKEQTKDVFSTPSAPTEYLTRKEVANILKINLVTLWRWTNKGVLPSHGIMGRVYYKRHEVDNAVIKLGK